MNNTDTGALLPVTPEDRDLFKTLFVASPDDRMSSVTIDRGLWDDDWRMKEIAKARHRHQSETGAALTSDGREADDPARTLKNALFALEKAKAPETYYGGVLTDDGRFAWVSYQLLPQGQRPALAHPVEAGEDDEMVDCENCGQVNLKNRRVTCVFCHAALGSRP